jgi:hypothetical protein
MYATTHHSSPLEELMSDPAKRGMPALAVLAMAVGAVSCGGGGGTEATADPAPSGVPHMEVQVAQTIGIELGDTNYVFGTIADAVPTPEGGVVVLDMFSLNIREYGSDGLLIASAGREGSGPGEFLMPRGLAILGNGKLLVSDMSAGAVSVFDDTLGWEQSIAGFSPRPPFTMRASGDSTYAGMLPNFDRAAGTMGYSIVGLALSSPEPFSVYAEEEYPFDPSRMGPSAEDDQPLFAAGSDGSVFISPPGPDMINVLGFTAAGEDLLEISRPVDRIEKTPEQLADEEAEFEEMSSRRSAGRRFGGGAAVFDPDPFRRAVTALGVDASGRLWVRLGAYEYPFWSVYDTSGELLFTASLELDDPDIDDMTVRIESEGAVAWVEDPGTWPRVHLLTLPE